jgi:hypothetical protein
MSGNRNKSLNHALAVVRNDMGRWDAIHSFISLLLLAGAAVSLSPSLHWLGWPTAIVIDAYLFMLLLVAACRCYWWLPERLTALFIVPAIFAALVLAFATVFLTCDCFTKRELGNDPKTAAVTVSTTKLPDAREATYVSLAVITTAAADYAPADSAGRYAVGVETVSGLLFLLVAFPILAARLAEFEEGASPPGVPKGEFRVKRMSDGKWEVTVIEKKKKTSDEVLGDEAEVIIENGQIISVKKPS